MCLRFPKIFPNGFKPTFHPERLEEPWKYRKPSKIFVCSISDLFAPWTLPKWRNAVLDSIEGCPVDHTFQLLTKNPERIPIGNWAIMKKIWIGTTITNENDDWRNLEHIKKVQAIVRFASFEPLLGKLPLDAASLRGLDWIIIGKLTGSRKVQLDPQWVYDILGLAQIRDIPVFIKNNILNNYPEFPKFQQFPREV
jgi:protein gp37